jgi:hypothetical protein
LTRTPPGLLLVWTDMAAQEQHDFNEWYNRDHMRERILGIPGFLLGRRFVAYQGGPQFLATYQAKDAAVMQSAGYLHLKHNPDAVSRRFIPQFANVQKGVFDTTAETGAAEGAFVAMIPLRRERGREAALRAWMNATLMPELLAAHGIMAARYAEGNPAGTESAIDGHMRGGDHVMDALLMIEAVSDEDLVAAMPLVAEARLAAQGAKPDRAPARLRVIYTLRPGVQA